MTAYLKLRKIDHAILAVFKTDNYNEVCIFLEYQMKVTSIIILMPPCYMYLEIP